MEGCVSGMGATLGVKAPAAIGLAPCEQVSSLLGAQRLVDQTNHVRDPEANKRCEEERHRALERPLPKEGKQAAYHANGQPRSGRACRDIERPLMHKQRNDDEEGEDARNKHGH